MSGQIVLSAVYLKQQKPQPETEEIETSNENQVSKTVVTNATL